MSSIEEFLINLRNEAKEARPGILPKDTKFESYIGHTVINLSNTPLNQHQIKALEKDLTFCPTPSPPDKSQRWLDFKEFYRRLELMEFFNREKSETPDPLNNQSIIDFMNQNVQSDTNESQLEDSKIKEIQKIFKPKHQKYSRGQLNRKYWKVNLKSVSTKTSQGKNQKA